MFSSLVFAAYMLHTLDHVDLLMLDSLKFIKLISPTILIFGMQGLQADTPLWTSQTMLIFLFYQYVYLIHLFKFMTQVMCKEKDIKVFGVEFLYPLVLLLPHFVFKAD
jgi:hypothetical protein